MLPATLHSVYGLIPIPVIVFHSVIDLEET